MRGKCQIRCAECAVTGEVIKAEEHPLMTWTLDDVSQVTDMFSTLVYK